MCSCSISTTCDSKVPGHGSNDSTFAFGFQGSQWIPLNNRYMLMFLAMADVICLDEIIMAKAAFLQQLHQRCLDACPNVPTMLPFAGKIILLGGDKHQLAAMCDRTCDEDACIHQP
ncbi:hypothetical protein VOLCADRAFT_95307 [Volvox carteri f. nagariensis]|uniref:ATP-dependent DNA helicase n=1 Tax=Volvox carteri f. nagariensis TaxID=3068 RepID=D8U747_VOLCA|nr:uncharacterized protein VOLCADRAFT_95307 [Volvox carteri f. nagariensis]EFJ44419.1 hypothetical protein VOLCADRAFT_95307 [Volvox carteri f. nagariensis]|eukprot:XP_002954526.1 hypothetical protein VOLCADRAFT_95307 [Volvox carteri f. nagariensis]